MPSAIYAEWFVVLLENIHSPAETKNWMNEEKKKLSLESDGTEVQKVSSEPDQIEHNLFSPAEVLKCLQMRSP